MTLEYDPRDYSDDPGEAAAAQAETDDLLHRMAARLVDAGNDPAAVADLVGLPRSMVARFASASTAQP